LRSCAGALFAEPLNAGAGGAATRFRMTYNCPRSWAEVQASLDKIEAAYRFLGQPTVAEMEVAFDVYDAAGSRDRLGGITHDMFKYTTHHPSHNARLQPAYDQSDPSTKMRPVGALTKSAIEVRRMLKEGGTLYVGDSSEAVSQRYYLKTTDQAGTVKLPTDQWRARMEITQRAMEGGLPFRTIDEARAFKFETLTQLGFRFRLPVEGEPDDDRMLSFFRVVSPVRGLPGEYGRRKYDPSTKADLALNAKARVALRRLTRQMCRVPPGCEGARAIVARTKIRSGPNEGSEAKSLMTKEFALAK
jgi:hypothetical protein